MKTLITTAVVVLILVPTAFATGSALDPRVPALKRQITNLNVRMSAVESSNLNKIDKTCVRLIPVVIRPGYVYQTSNGSFVIYKAFDEWNSQIDSAPNKMMDYIC